MTSRPKERTRERQYQFLLQMEANEPAQQFGLMSSQVWRDDPRRLGFVLARYKFVAKMFSGLSRVLEVGCADGFFTRVVRQEVPRVVATDFDPVFIERNQARVDPKWPIEFRTHDLLKGPIREDFDGVYCLDVIEHIPKPKSRRFVRHLAASAAPNGVCIVGTPSLESQQYASKPSREGHVNCMSGPNLKRLLLASFHNVFVFSMNDEVVHTGFHPMAHYLMALCCGPRRT